MKSPECACFLLLAAVTKQDIKKLPDHLWELELGRVSWPLSELLQTGEDTGVEGVLVGRWVDGLCGG